MGITYSRVSEMTHSVGWNPPSSSAIQYIQYPTELGTEYKHSSVTLGLISLDVCLCALPVSTKALRAPLGNLAQTFYHDIRLAQVEPTRQSSCLLGRMPTCPATPMAKWPRTSCSRRGVFSGELDLLRRTLDD